VQWSLWRFEQSDVARGNVAALSKEAAGPDMMKDRGRERVGTWLAR
jgi:hypothetical protein